MARIAGVDLPRTKRVEVGLTYIYGIGRKRSNDILTEAGVSSDIRVKDLSEEDVRKISRVIEELDEHQAADGNRQLPRPAASPQPAGARTAHEDQRAHPQGPAQGCGGEEEDGLTAVS